MVGVKKVVNAIIHMGRVIEECMTAGRNSVKLAERMKIKTLKHRNAFRYRESKTMEIISINAMVLGHLVAT